MKLYDNKNPNVRRLSLLFIIQILMGVLPAVLFIAYVVVVQRIHRIDPLLEEYGYTLWLGIIFICVIFFTFVTYAAAARKYNIIASGERGERVLKRIARQLKGNYTVFANVPIRYKNNRSEIDLLIISERGILAIEVKNHSGAIIGADNSEFWIHRKFYRKGKITETEMKNPLKQVKRQREILKNILRSNGHDVWIDSVLFFSGSPALKLRTKSDIGIATSEDEIFGLIKDYENPLKPLCAGECADIVRLLREQSLRL
jgi:hypothetical protein